ncbi:hypothetical protein [Pontibacter mangrovi]|uniref:Uncharacterized protein n=1 Tax=Pontibacter mangrovi TaxID=2589816 RepID=A0A501WFZ5_9BACT|nr:hypothetical protein [Pontibacter mangrovi]TPE45907.1 hypothetical protein FJM65_00755 [Pontibacter mangrovi]
MVLLKKAFKILWLSISLLLMFLPVIVILLFLVSNYNGFLDPYGLGFTILLCALLWFIGMVVYLFIDKKLVRKITVTVISLGFAILLGQAVSLIRSYKRDKFLTAYFLKKKESMALAAKSILNKEWSYHKASLYIWDFDGRYIDDVKIFSCDDYRGEAVVFGYFNLNRKKYAFDEFEGWAYLPAHTKALLPAEMCNMVFTSCERIDSNWLKWTAMTRQKTVPEMFPTLTEEELRILYHD